MDGLLFPIEDYTDERIKTIMQRKTYRMCGNWIRHQYNNNYFYCAATPSRRTSNGLLKVKSNQPACINFTNKTNEQ